MRWCPRADSKVDDDALGYMLEGAHASAEAFWAEYETMRSKSERTEFLRRHFAKNDLVIAIWFEDGGLEWLPVKGAELLDDPSLIGSKNVVDFAGIPCADEYGASLLLQIACGFEVKH